MAPFHLQFTLTRRQRLSVELIPWLPAIAASAGFAVGTAFLAVNVSGWFLPLLLLPLIVYRSLSAFLFGIVRGGLAVEVIADDTSLTVRSDGASKWLPLDGIFQVFCSDDVWIVLHLDGSVLTIPVDAITAEQIEYLKSFARRSAAERN